MKTAISIPDDVFEEADRLAARLGTSRSELYTRAIRAFVEARRREEITRRINEVCAQVDTGLDEGLADLQAASVADDAW